MQNASHRHLSENNAILLPSLFWKNKEIYTSTLPIESTWRCKNKYDEYILVYLEVSNNSFSNTSPKFQNES